MYLYRRLLCETLQRRAALKTIPFLREHGMHGSAPGFGHAEEETASLNKRRPRLSDIPTQPRQKQQKLVSSR
jgi:hypothetical protein